MPESQKCQKETSGMNSPCEHCGQKFPPEESGIRNLPTEQSVATLSIVGCMLVGRFKGEKAIEKFYRWYPRSVGDTRGPVALSCPDAD